MAGGHIIERVTDREHQMYEQFEQQRHTNDTSLFDFEKDLRNDGKSFDTMRTLSPTRYRFRVKNAQGVDVRALADDRTLTDISTVEDPPHTCAQDASASLDHIDPATPHV